MKNYLNAVIIGCGAISKVHAAAINTSEFAKLYGVCDTDKAKLDTAVETYGCKGYNSIEEVLADENVDVVHICTPHYLHAPMLEASVKAGKKVVVEKPMTMNFDEYRHAYDVVKEYNGTVCSIIQNRFNPCIVKIKEMIENGKYGKVMGLRGILTWKRDAKYYASGQWRGKWDTEGGGVVINQALHTIDLLCYLGKKPQSVKANYDNRSLQGIIEVEDTAEALIRMEDGVNALFYATNAYCRDSCYDLEVVLENAYLKYMLNNLYLIENGEMTLLESDKMEVCGKSCWGGGHATVIGNFYSNLTGHGGKYTPFESAEEYIGVFDALYKSAKSHKEEKVETM
ncbi:MAG: Gfo/Idh/MocA family oxidoreductase [Clostridia bacterium]|nr:Gfo/Idh/MocA family oxidoreductase [Clostridia bacterium]